MSAGVDDRPTIPSRWKSGGSRNTRRLNASSAAEVIAGMLAGRATLHELVERSGLCLHTVRSYVKAMHKRGVCHIAGWRTDKRGAYTTPAWSLGAFPDAAKPLPLDDAARGRALRRAKKLREQGHDVAAAALLGRKVGQSVQPGRVHKVLP